MWSFTTETQLSGQWHQTNGPYGGGDIKSLAIDPTNTQMLYAGT
ncbi:MAG: hypothetical protein QMD92_08080 [bacterium]|nr:hypothetical protein [bacterium]